MATRGIVRIIERFDNNKKVQIDLYHHWDCYPSGLGVGLMEKFYDKDKKEFSIHKNVDYIANGLIKDENFCFEVTGYNHIDIEYLYIIDINKNRIICKRVNNWDKLKVLETIDLIPVYEKHLKEQGLQKNDFVVQS